MEPGLAGGVTLSQRPSLVEPQAGGRQHEAWIDPVVASRETAAGAGACTGPAGAAACRVPAAAEDVQHLGDDGYRLAGVDPSRPGGRADLDALAATGAAIKDLAYPNVKGGDKGVSAVGHVFPQIILPLRQQLVADHHVEGDIFKNVLLCQLDGKEAILKSVRPGLPALIRPAISKPQAAS
ncbi:MAG TPA: hypothetical protein VLJ79_00890 [Candidatus Binatia bacterium]|nr:hypothetical protein [Candidatus Binatia bacterium]